MQKSDPMRYPLVAFLTVLLLSLTSCGPHELIRERYVFIVNHDVPQDPSFVVLPQDRYAAETDFAERVESVLIGSGFRLVDRPAKKLIATERSTATGNASANSGMINSESRATQARVTETYYALEDIDADYLVYTRASVNQVKLTETEEEAAARPDRPTNPTKPGRYFNNVYDVARVRVVHRATGEVVANFELTLNSEASERLSEALSKLVESSA